MQPMSTATDPTHSIPAGVPELTALGRQVEMLRLDRGLSKQGLARGAGTSRQQLWRVMTGKSELTTSLCQRLAEVLGVDARALRDPGAFAHSVGNLALRTAGERAGAIARRGASVIPDHRPSAAPSVAEYLADPRWI